MGRQGLGKETDKHLVSEERQADSPRQTDGDSGERVRVGHTGAQEKPDRGDPAGALRSTGDQPPPGALRPGFPVSARVLDHPPSPTALTPRLRSGEEAEAQGGEG